MAGVLQALEPIRTFEIYHEIKRENNLTEARDYLANERSFGTGLKLVLSLCIVGGYFFMRIPEDKNSTLDRALGGTIFALAFLLLLVLVGSYFGIVNQYNAEELQGFNPVWIMVTVLIVGFFALGLSIAEFFIESDDHRLT